MSHLTAANNDIGVDRGVYPDLSRPGRDPIGAVTHKVDRYAVTHKIDCFAERDSEGGGDGGAGGGEDGGHLRLSKGQEAFDDHGVELRVGGNG